MNVSDLKRHDQIKLPHWGSEIVTERTPSVSRVIFIDRMSDRPACIVLTECSLSGSLLPEVFGDDLMQQMIDKYGVESGND